uniref:Desmoglein 2 n=1 Tax=Myripristis murdjan TaxID=586833 RepID=A0A667Y0G7_9TELE
RNKREWIIPPMLVTENKEYPKDKIIAKIRSDSAPTDGSLRYSLGGAGANQPPYNVFIVNPETGDVTVTRKLDRESIHQYNLSGIATFPNGSKAEKDIEIRIRVEDQNDNPPKFGKIDPGFVDELSAKDTFVMKITAYDADEQGNDNSKVAYSIVNQNPSHDMFWMSRDGNIYVKKDTLDRETQDKYILTVLGQDLDGRREGNTATATVTINIRDVNDHLPTLEKEYEGSIEENTEGVEVMRIKAVDLDLEHTENWEAVFDIIGGNEAGYFSIKTDPETNEGILMLDKAVNYEDVKDLDLQLAVKNKGSPYGAMTNVNMGGGGGGAGAGGAGAGGAGAGGAGAGGAGGSGGAGAGGAGGYKTYPIKINVKNQPEGPRFDPKVKAIPIPEGGDTVNIKEVIARYPAIDEDTGKPAENVRYVKGSDPGNWLSIDPETAEIRLNKLPDRESPQLVNGTYFAQVLCISEDMPSKTATGTIAIQVEDFNDQCPKLTSHVQSMCTTADAVTVTAVDEDAFPNGAPFTFTVIPEETKGKWKVENLNETSAILRAQENMWPGSYEVAVEVKDQQGLACPDLQRIKVEVCTCANGKDCSSREALGSLPGAELGASAIGLIFLGLLMLLLIPLLLLFCNCGGAGGLAGGFTEMPFDTKSHLIAYHTEGQGENTEVPLLNMPTQVDGEIAKLATVANGTMAVPVGAGGFQMSSASMDGAFYQDGYTGGYKDGAWGMMSQTGMMSQADMMGQAGMMGQGGQGSGLYSEFERRETGGMYDGIALPCHFLEQYYSQKASCAADNQATKDSLLVYDYEGQGSCAGSVGCCSLLETDNDLQFLDDLGPKFKTLAEVCSGKEIKIERKKEINLPPMPTINTVTSVSSVMSRTVLKESSERTHMVRENVATVKEMKEGAIKVREGMTNQGQTVLLQQQPVYYTTTPVLQPNTMLLAETPATNLQGMIVVNGAQTAAAPGMVLQGQTVMSGTPVQGQSMVLVERGGAVGQGVHVEGLGTNLIHTGNLSGSQAMMVVEGKVPVGSTQVLQGSQARLVQGGTLQRGGLSGSQSVLVVEGPKASGGQLVQGAGLLSEISGLSGSQSVLYTKGGASSSSQYGSMAGMNGSSTTVSTAAGHPKVLVQEKRVITTENITG